jgi:hypothetical protein
MVCGGRPGKRRLDGVCELNGRQLAPTGPRRSTQPSCAMMLDVAHTTSPTLVADYA